MAADQPHFNADISMTNPPERRLLPEKAIERFRRICCHSRWPSAGQSADHPSQSDPRRSAPRANRCYLPADASPLIPSIVLNFLPEFVRHYDRGCEGCREIVTPKLTDFDEATGKFTYAETTAAADVAGWFG